MCADVPSVRELNVMLDDMRKTFKSNSINCLPDEVLLLILEKLSFREDGSEVVCKRWNRLRRNTLVQSANIFVFCFQCQQDWEKDLRERDGIRCSSVVKLVGHASQTRLQALIIEGGNVSAGSLESVAQYLPNIKSVSIGQVVKECFSGLKELFVNCQLEKSTHLGCSCSSGF
uniref:F-box domain-containing protein n=1 Tax=Ditylenchus dipsaci TaxID=166011 RepID=A0A915DWE8_9BILA